MEKFEAALLAIQLAQKLVGAVKTDELTDEQRNQLFERGEELNAQWAALSPRHD